MQKICLDARIRQEMARASDASSRRSATTVYGGHEHTLRQTLVAVMSGAVMDDHESPGEATMLVLRGRVRMSTDATDWEGREGDLLLIPGARHAVRALEDSVVLLTVAKGG